MTPEVQDSYFGAPLYAHVSLGMARPRWFADAKWLSGIALFLALSVTFSLYGLYKITEQKTSVEILATTMASAITATASQGNAVGDLTELVRRAKAYPDQEVALPPFTLPVKGKEIASLSPRQAAIYVLRQVFERFYAGGPDALARIIDNPRRQADLLNTSSSLALFTREGHDQLLTPLILAGASSVLVMILVVFFSFRFGKLASPGCAFFAAGLPGAVAFSLLASPGLLESPAVSSMEESVGLLGAVAPMVLPLTSAAVSETYVLATAAGLGAILLSMLGSLIVWAIKRMRATGSPELSLADPAAPAETHSESA